MLEDLIKLSHQPVKKAIKYPKEILKNRNDFCKYIKHVASKSDIDVQTELKQIEQEKIKLLHYHCDDYPEYLKHIADPPLVFYTLGDVSLLKKPIVAIVGSREPTMNNIYMTQELSKFLTENNITVISGLARGIDATAHHNSLNNTIAVLGTGFNKLYPKENIGLFNKIKEKSLIISEYPLNRLPLKYNFPQRNRLIAALADIVVVIEAKERSGSLITARFALEYNKDIFAVSGHSLDMKSRGSNLLIKNGANMLLDFEEILELLAVKYSSKTNNMSFQKTVQNNNVTTASLSKLEYQIINLLSEISLDPEEIAKKLTITPQLLNKILSKLELNNKIYRENGGQICLRY